MNPHVQWLGAPPYEWKSTPNDDVKKLQVALYTLLNKLGYIMPTVDGVISPTTCGAFAVVANAAAAKEITIDEWATVLAVPGAAEIGTACQGPGKTMIAPKRPDGSGGGEFYTDTGKPVSTPTDTKKTKTKNTALIVGVVVSVAALAAVFYKKGQ